MHKIQTMRELLNAALSESLFEGWLFLPDIERLSLEMRCLLLSNDEFDQDSDTPLIAQTLGFSIEGLDTGTIQDITRWARKFNDPPSDELLLESFVYYRRFDSFLPRPGAPDPPSWEETQQHLDREFYDKLGDERKEVGCRKPDCKHGAIALSIYCKAHHFESVMKKPCPFVD